MAVHRGNHTFLKLLGILNPIYTSTPDNLSGSKLKISSLVVIFTAMSAIQSYLFLTNVVSEIPPESDLRAIYLGNPYEVAGASRTFLQATFAYWILANWLIIMWDICCRKRKSTYFWALQMNQLFNGLTMDSTQLSKIHNLSTENFTDISIKFLRLFSAVRMSFVISFLSTGLTELPTWLKYPTFWPYHIFWLIIHTIAAISMLLRFYVYPFTFLLCVTTFEHKLVHVFKPMKLNKLEKMNDQTLIPIRETNTINEMKTMARLYKDMFMYNRYWSANIGIVHCFTFMACSYILYPIFFVKANLFFKFGQIFWAGICFSLFIVPYLMVSYMNAKIAWVNKKIFSKIKDLANPFEAIRLMVTMEHIGAFKGFSLLDFHEPSYQSMIYQTLDLITYFLLFIKSLGFQSN